MSEIKFRTIESLEIPSSHFIFHGGEEEAPGVLVLGALDYLELPVAHIVLDRSVSHNEQFLAQIWEDEDFGNVTREMVVTREPVVGYPVIMLGEIDSLELTNEPPYIIATMSMDGAGDTLEILTHEAVVSGSLAAEIDTLEVRSFTFRITPRMFMGVVDNLTITPAQAIGANTIALIGEKDYLELDQAEVHAVAPPIEMVPWESLETRPMLVEYEAYLPVRLKRAETPTGGALTTNSISAQQQYFPPPPVGAEPDRTNLWYTQITGLMPDYLPADESVFSHTQYRAFYIVNDSHYTRENIDFWVDGGTVYRLDQDRISEGRFFLEDEENDSGITLADRENLLLSGSSRTSLFGQIDIEYALSDETVKVDGDTGRVVGLDLSTLHFVKGNEPSRIDKLEGGESMGVYIKITTKFSPDFPITSDYSFFHLRYTTPYNNLREMYPGVIGVPGATTGTTLPSMYMKVSSSFEGLRNSLKEDVDFTYSRYPTYFAAQEDVDDVW